MYIYKTMTFVEASYHFPTHGAKLEARNYSMKIVTSDGYMIKFSVLSYNIKLYYKFETLKHVTLYIIVQKYIK